MLPVEPLISRSAGVHRRNSYRKRNLSCENEVRPTFSFCRVGRHGLTYIPAPVQFSFPQRTFIAMGDGSFVRIKAVQYHVNEKHEELRSKKATFSATLDHDDPSILQYLPPVGADEYTQEQPASAPTQELPLEPPELPPELASELPPQLPPELSSLFSSTDQVPWEDMLNLYRESGPKHSGIWPVVPPWYRVAIIGAGVAGLRTAMLLQYMGIPYKIFEASNRPGGRVFTYHFSSRPEEDPQGKHDYYDVGAMRFPDNDANRQTYKLFKKLDLSTKEIPYVFSRDENIRLYNGQC
jgi:Flavin containing amine oxidoreductase